MFGYPLLTNSNIGKRKLNNDSNEDQPANELMHHTEFNNKFILKYQEYRNHRLPPLRTHNVFELKSRQREIRGTKSDNSKILYKGNELSFLNLAESSKRKSITPIKGIEEPTTDRKIILNERMNS